MIKNGDKMSDSETEIECIECGNRFDPEQGVKICPGCGHNNEPEPEPPSEKDLSRTGKKIALLFEMVKTSLTKNEIQEFLDYISHNTSIGPLLNPQQWNNDTHRQFDMARNRADVLMQMLYLLEEEAKEGQ